MPNFTSILKQEISRLARKEIRTEVEALKKSSARYRSEIAALKRRIEVLERKLAQKPRGNGKASAPDADDSIHVANGSSRDGAASIRYSAKSLASQRKRLGLSAAEFGKLIGVSAQSIYNWEAQKARPREKQLAAFAAVRQMGRRDAVSILSQQ